jgi:hypothetical protein
MFALTSICRMCFLLFLDKEERAACMETSDCSTISMEFPRMAIIWLLAQFKEIKHWKLLPVLSLTAAMVRTGKCLLKIVAGRLLRPQTLRNGLGMWRFRMQTDVLRVPSKLWMLECKFGAVGSTFKPTSRQNTWQKRLNGVRCTRLWTRCSRLIVCDRWNPGSDWVVGFRFYAHFMLIFFIRQRRLEHS